MLMMDGALARRLERAAAENAGRWAATCARLYPDACAGSEPLAGGTLVFGGAGSPIGGGVGLGMAGPVTEADLDRIEQFYAALGVPASLALCPLADRSLVEGVARRGYVVRFFLNVFVLPLVGLSTPFRPAPGVTVEEVGPEEFALWADTVNAGFGGGPSDPGPNIARVNTACTGVSCFLARVDGVPAAGAAMEMNDGLAGLFSTATLPEFRGRGAQTALLQARLAAAQALGCDLATVSTSPGSGSQRNVERAGFRLAYTRVKLARPE